MVLAVVLLGAVSLGVAEGWTRWSSEGHGRQAAEGRSEGEVGLVLGCSPYVQGGRRNLYFEGRMDAAAALWRSGRVEGLIVSGDNRHASYNEPQAMKAALVDRGVPDGRVVCDYGGICTYDSVARASQVFGASRLVVVSQAEHAVRAVAIARYLGVEAEAVAASPPPVTRATWFRNFLRERCARVAMVYDLLTARQPHFRGAPEPLPWR